jgi:3-methylcrotonyl-CoA carboxylase alpha subunit
MSEFRYKNAPPVSIERNGDSFTVRIADRAYTVHAEQGANGQIRFHVGDQWITAYVAADSKDKNTRYVAVHGSTYTFTREEARKRRGGAGGSAGETLSATMHGQVIKIGVSEGEAVQRGHVLVILEAMKMEIRVTAPADGRVGRILCSVGQVVERGQTLVEFAET